MHSSEELIRGFQSSTDEQVRNEIFTHIYRRYIKLVFFAINKFSGILTDEDMEEAAQDAFIFIAGELDDFRWLGEKAFTTRVYFIAYNKAREKAREKRVIHEPIEAAGQVSNEDNPDPSLPLLKLFEIWKEFDPEGFELVYLLYIEKRSTEDLAGMLGVTARTVRRWRASALEKFSRYLMERYNVASVEEWIEQFNSEKR